MKRRGLKAKLQKRQLMRAVMFIVPLAIAFPVAVYLYGFGKVRLEQQAIALRPLTELRWEPESVATASIGEEFLLDGVGYRVTGAVPRGNTYGFQHADGRFIQISVIAMNSGEHTATPAAISILRHDGAAFAQLPQFSKDGTSYSEVLTRGMAPSSGGKYFALFDVASGSSDLSLSFHGRDGMSARIVPLGM